MLLQERFKINDIIEHKINGKTWAEAAEKVVPNGNNEKLIESAKLENSRRIEEDYYIHSLS